MGGVDLDGIEAGFDRISRRSCPGAHHRPTLVGRELARGQPSRRDRLAGGTYRLPQPGARLDFLRGERAHAIHRALRGRLAPAMRELDADSHPSPFMKAINGLKLCTCASLQMPRSFSLIRPTSSTAVASTNTRPKPPSA